jgi:hypothetical protein
MTPILKGKKSLELWGETVQNLKARVQRNCRKQPLWRGLSFFFFLTPERRDLLTARLGQLPCEAPARPEFPRPAPASGFRPAVHYQLWPLGARWDARRRRRRRRRPCSAFASPRAQTGGGSGELHTERARAPGASCSATAPRGRPGSAPQPPPISGPSCRERRRRRWPRSRPARDALRPRPRVQLAAPAMGLGGSGAPPS